MKRIFNLLYFFAATLFISCSTGTNNKSKDSQLPNIVIIYVDDLGYGDVGSYGAIGVETPNIDKMVTNGMKFTDAHSAASTCTPSRFSLLTGKYAFRNKAAILPGDAPLLIRPGTPTVASMLKQYGYTTGVVGKWHLGLGDGKVNWNEHIKPGPAEIGFDYSFLLPATGDRVPCVWVENQRVVGLDPNDPIEVSYSQLIGDEPIGTKHPELLKFLADKQHSQAIIDSVSRIGYMIGGHAARWKDEEFPDVLTAKAKEFIAENKNNPFFLFYSYHDIHVPRVPNKRFVGKSTMGPRGDAIAQMDWCTGEIMNYLEELGIADNTLILFTSDNGPVLNDGYDDKAEEMLGEHKPWGIYRGGKYSAYEAGTRVPTIAYWPSKIKQGESSALVNQVDFYGSIAKLVGHELKENEAPDSYNLLPQLMGESNAGRDKMIEEAFVLAVRDGDWKYIEPGRKAPQWLKNKKIESGLMETPQLFNLKDDIREQHNIIDQHPEKAKEMKQLLNELVENNLSRALQKQ